MLSYACTKKGILIKKILYQKRRLYSAAKQLLLPPELITSTGCYALALSIQVVKAVQFRYGLFLVYPPLQSACYVCLLRVRNFVTKYLTQGKITSKGDILKSGSKSSPAQQDSLLHGEHAHPHTHTYGQSSISNSPNLHVFGLWKETHIHSGRTCKPKRKDSCITP